MEKKIKGYPELHQYGMVSIENPDQKSVRGDFGVQISEDGRVWICIDGKAFIRFKPMIK